MASFTERINKLVARIERCDSQIAEATALREQLVNEVVGLVGGTPTVAKTVVSSKPAAKLGDRIVSILTDDSGLTKETIISRLKSDAQKVALSLYHLTHKGVVYEWNGTYHLTQPAAAKTAVSEMSE